MMGNFLNGFILSSKLLYSFALQLNPDATLIKVNPIKFGWLLTAWYNIWAFWLLKALSFTIIVKLCKFRCDRRAIDVQNYTLKSKQGYTHAFQKSKHIKKRGRIKNDPQIIVQTKQRGLPQLACLPVTYRKTSEMDCSCCSFNASSLTLQVIQSPAQENLLGSVAKFIMGIAPNIPPIPIMLGFAIMLGFTILGLAIIGLLGSIGLFKQ